MNAMLSIIIVNWNTGRLLTKCLQSLQQLPEADRSLVSTVFVVDNASSDDSVAQAKKVAGPVPVKWVELRANRGFAAANNVAIKQCSNEHILLLNPDTEVKPGALPALHKVLGENPAAGIVGCKLLNTDGTLQPSVRAFPTLATFIFMFKKLPRLFPSARLWQNYLRTDFDYAREQTVDQVMGAAFLIRNEVIQKVGLLDETFFVWFEEVDYCRRAKQAGWGVLYTPHAEIIHHGGASFHQLIGLKKSLPWLKSSLHYTRKHLSFAAYTVLLLFSPLALLLALLAAPTHRQIQAANKARL